MSDNMPAANKWEIDKGAAHKKVPPGKS